MKKTLLITTFFLCIITIQSCAQSRTKDKKNTDAELLELEKGPNDFPELIHTNIPGAPKLGKPQLIMGDSIPVRGEGLGWAAPAVYDWDGDGKKDLLIGEFGSGIEKGLGTIGNFIRIYQNKGKDSVPEFYDDFIYAREVDELKESTGTPLSIYTFCCLAFTPRFVDLDSDGYTDLLSGQYTPGYITWFRGSENGFLPGIKLEEAYDPIRDRVKGIASDSLAITDPKGFNYWMYTSAAFGDFDNDGDQDMIVGGKALRICKNIGTKLTPKFGKRELLFDTKGNKLESSLSGTSTVPYVVDWDQDGVLDILLTDSFTNMGSIAVSYFRGLKSKEGLRFETGIPLFTAKNNEKTFPGSWLNVSVTDWNNDGVQDLLIGTSVAILNGTFNHELSWKWEHNTGISKKNPAYYPVRMKRVITSQIKGAEALQKKLDLSDEEMKKKGYMIKEDVIKHYYRKEAYRTLAHQGYVYVMLGEK